MHFQSRMLIWLNSFSILAPKELVVPSQIFERDRSAAILTETDQLGVRIEIATRNVREDYEKAVGTVGMLKEKMNELEQRIGRKKPEKAAEDASSLRSAIDSLERFTDSEILKSKEAWKKYEELKRECENRALTPKQLDELRTMCKRTEQLAADLLCYSLGLIKQKSTEKTEQNNRTPSI